MLNLLNIVLFLLLEVTAQDWSCQRQRHTLCIAIDPYYLPKQPYRDPQLPLLTTHLACTRNHTSTFELPFDPHLEEVDSSSTHAVVRWLTHLLLSTNTSCDWTYIIPKESYVNVDALHQRLGLFNADEAWMFGRMVGRLSLVHAFYNGRRVKSPIMRSGIIISKGALSVLEESHPSGQIDAGLAEAWVTRSRQEIPEGQDETNSVDGVGYREEDYAFAMYLVASTNFRLQLSNFGSYRQHFLIANDIKSRLQARREALHPDYPPPSCVLQAWPVSADDAFELVHNKGLSEFEVMCSPCDDRLTQLVGESTYSWLEEATGDFIEEPYYTLPVKDALTQCEHLHMPPGGVLLRHRNIRSYDNGVIILAPPGQGTSWVFDNFKEGWPAEHEDAIIQADYWHPYCNEMYRHELSMVFSAAEDDTKKDLLSPQFNDHALDAVVRLLTNGGEKLVVTKEVMNLFRVIDLAELKGHTILLLYRKRKHTFPMSNPPCRTCFYEALRESLLVHNYSHPMMVLAQRIIKPLMADTPETHAMLHAVLWRLILWRLPNPRVLAFHDLIMADSKRALIEVYERAWSHDGRLKQVVDFDKVANRTIDTRKSIEWLKSKERRYDSVVSAEWEQFIGLALDRFREIDPATDDTIIRDHVTDNYHVNQRYPSWMRYVFCLQSVVVDANLFNT